MYEAYVYDANSFNSLGEAIDAGRDHPETQTSPYSVAVFETLAELEQFSAGVEAVNDLPGIQHFAIEAVKHFELKMYRGADYDESYSDALKDGAVYDTKVLVPIAKLKDKNRLHIYNQLVDRTEYCINNGQSNMQLLLVHPLFPEKFHRLSDFL